MKFLSTLFLLLCTILLQTTISSTITPPFTITQEDTLNPDDFHRMDIDVEKEIARISQYPTQAAPGMHSRYAYVLIHYEGTPKDDLYVLGTRVVIRSIIESGSQQDVVIVCAQNVRESTKEQFKRDGAIIKMVPNIPNPYKSEQQHRRSYKPRFEFTFNKLYMWNLLEYERVIFNDADNLITRNMDELFLCGHYCATYFNPLFFHTGMMVIKPDQSLFKQLLKGLLNLEIFSYDGADQGFLTAAFPGIERAEMFNPARILAENKGKPSEKTLMRFPMEYNFNSVFYYGTMSFERFREANLPFSYMAYDQARKTGLKIVPPSSVISPYTAVYPPVPPPTDNPNRLNIYDALTTIPESNLDYQIPVGSIDYSSAVILKPWNYFPYIFLHTVRIWSPIRNRIEAADLKAGFLPTSHGFFLESLNYGVLPLILLPFVLNIVARLIPFMDHVRKINRIIVRFTGTLIPSSIAVLLTFGASLQLVANVVPLETRPELAYVCVFLIVILAQFNLAYLFAILLSPPCPDMFKDNNNTLHNGITASNAIPQTFQTDKDGLSQLEEIGIYRTTMYGLTWYQLSQFFRSLGTIQFVTPQIAQTTMDLPFNLKNNQNNSTNKSFTAKSTEIISSSVILDQDNDSNALHTVNNGTTTFDDDDEFDLDDDQSTLDIDFVLQECDFQSNLVSVINAPPKTASFLHDLKANLSSTKKSGFSSQTNKQQQSSSYQLLNGQQAQNQSDQHMKSSDDVDLDIDMLDSDFEGMNDNQSPNNNNINDIERELDDLTLGTKTQRNNNTTTNKFINPTRQDRMIQNALKQTAVTTLSASLSLRGGIYPSLMIIHLIIGALMALYMAKYGVFHSFIDKLAYFAGFLLAFVIYSVVFLRKIMDIAIGTADSLGKVYL